MLKEDGERFLPWMADPVINYEHLHRYRAARDLAAGRAVLDMASGEGYGSALLAEVAVSVVGVELDHAAALYATKTYGRAGLCFIQGSITEPPLKAKQFDLIVCFEALEHVQQQERLCAEAARLLAPGGLFLVSTPNRKVYTEATGYHNPFHVKELDFDEFTALMRRHFAHRRMFGQHVYPVSALFRLAEPVRAAREYVIAREAGEPAFRFVDEGRKAPRYFLCIAANAPLPDALTLDAFLVDASEQLFEVQRRAEGAVVELERHLKTREEQVIDLDRQHAEARHQLAARSAQAIELDAQLAETQRHLAARSAQAIELAQTAESLRGTIELLRGTIAGMEATLAWRLHRRACGIRAWLRGLLGRAAG